VIKENIAYNKIGLLISALAIMVAAIDKANEVLCTPDSIDAVILLL